jgi:CRP-like cAMP-binding protein
MPAPDQLDYRNILMQLFPRGFTESLASQMRRVDLRVKRNLVVPDEATEEVFFLEAGLASVVAQSPDDQVVEIAHVGYEGMSGAHIILMNDRTPNKTFMQIEGYGYAIASRFLMDALMKSDVEYDIMRRYVYSCELQVAQSALANARYRMHERLARWLLMCHDRIEGDELPLTHELLATMLGVRRSGVTDELHILEDKQAITTTRGKVVVVNRTGLEAIARGCYGLPEREYARLLGRDFRRG